MTTEAKSTEKGSGVTRARHFGGSVASLIRPQCSACNGRCRNISHWSTRRLVIVAACMPLLGGLIAVPLGGNPFSNALSAFIITGILYVRPLIDRAFDIQRPTPTNAKAPTWRADP